MCNLHTKFTDQLLTCDRLQGYPDPYGRGGGYGGPSAYGGMGPPGMGHPGMGPPGMGPPGMMGADPFFGGGGGGGGYGGPPPMTSSSGWAEYFTSEGEAYYHNHLTSASSRLLGSAVYVWAVYVTVALCVGPLLCALDCCSVHWIIAL